MGGSPSAGGTEGSGAVGTSGATGAGARPCTYDCENCGPLEECYGGKFCVAKPVTIPAPGGDSHQVDATEVTRCQYAAWLDTDPSVTGQDPWCAWDQSFAPGPECMAEQEACASDCDHHAQVCVNYCAAFAYCKSVGKHLCGAIGGGQAPFDAFADATQDEWYNACSSGGEYRYPYGNEYEGASCNGYDNPQSGCQASSDCGTRVGGDVATCASPLEEYQGVYDLSGGVFEWQDSCSSHVDGKDRCRFRGGSFVSTYGDDGGNALRCNYDIAGARDDQYGNLGFRCCGG